jgi:hypothetical protein
MSSTLVACKRERACRVNNTTGRRNCAALKVGQAECPEGSCCGKQGALLDTSVLQQRVFLTRHLCSKGVRPRSCRRLEPMTKHPRHDGTDRFRCKAAIHCPAGRCHARFHSAVSEAGLHEFAGVHGRKSQAGSYWELAALPAAGERPDPGRLIDRDEMCRAARVQASVPMFSA